MKSLVLNGVYMLRLFWRGELEKDKRMARAIFFLGNECQKAEKERTTKEQSLLLVGWFLSMMVDF